MFKLPTTTIIFALLANAGKSATAHDGLRGFGGGDSFGGAMNNDGDGSLFTNLTCNPAATLPACVPSGPGGRHHDGGDNNNNNNEGGFRGNGDFNGDHDGATGFGGGDRPDFFNDTNKNASTVDGTWVCRTMYNPYNGTKTTFTDCIDPNYALLTDQCGCCDDVCPDPCDCTCDLPYSTETGTGVLVLLPNRYNATATDDEVCVEPERAVSMVANGPATCKTTCDRRA